MKNQIDRRSFLRIAGTSVGIGVLYEFAPFLERRPEAGEMNSYFKRTNGEAPASFTFAQFSDPHVGFQGPPNPLGTKAFESAVALLNQSPQRPDFVLFTGDLTHDADSRDVHAERMQLFRKIAGGLNTRTIHTVPGENDAALDGGVLYREHFGESHYSFDHKGVHFVALDNVSQGSPEVGPAQLAWLKADLARFPKTAPIIVFTHRPLFDLKPQWEWFTRDGDAVMNALAPYENVTVLYGHIHRHDVHHSGKGDALRGALAHLRVQRSGDQREQKAVAVRQGRPVQGLGSPVRYRERRGRQGGGARRQRRRTHQGRVFRALGNAADDQAQQLNRWEFIQ